MLIITLVTLIDEEDCDDVPSKDDHSGMFPAEVPAKDAATLPEGAADEKKDIVDEDDESEEGELKFEDCALIPTFQSFREN